jgi:hypothetical protein
MKVDYTELHEQAVAVRNLLADKSRWITGGLAEDAQGNTVFPRAPEACKFCLVGAVVHVLGTKSADAYRAVEESPLGLLLANTILGMVGRNLCTPSAVHSDPIYQFNDRRQHEDVMEVLETVVAYTAGAKKAFV